MILHPIPPFFDENSRVLILGSFPSVKSREQGFFYGHPQNRFWRVLSEVFSLPIPNGIEEKKHLLHSCGIALWDVIASCSIQGSSDSSIRDETANDISLILNSCNIAQIFVNGRTAERLYRKHVEPNIHVPAVYLSSTSPANAAYSLERLCAEWKIVRLAAKTMPLLNK